MGCKNSEMWKGDRKWRREKIVAIQEHVNKLTLFFQGQTPTEVSGVKEICVQEPRLWSLTDPRSTLATTCIN